MHPKSDTDLDESRLGSNDWSGSNPTSVLGLRPPLHICAGRILEDVGGIKFYCRGAICGGQR